MFVHIQGVAFNNEGGQVREQYNDMSDRDVDQQLVERAQRGEKSWTVTEAFPWTS